MSFYKSVKINETTELFLWKITEDYNDLYRKVSLKDVSLARLDGMKSETHQNAFLSVRMLLQHCGYTDFDLFYDEFGKPHLQDGKHISISHALGFSAIILSNENVGIDLEQAKEKVLKIASRFMDVSHLENLTEEDQIHKATVIWGIKEAIFKLKNEKGISFPKHIFEAPFELKDKKCTAQLHFNNSVEDFDIAFDLVEDYVFVCAMKKK
ncbi:4'-phosphopantetheinyl transferase family protein [Flavobacterium luminosum]|uniref:4'-phosphopantetheinyl transferase superfamily protein n=1 Tax=Flavobacterium luminosum TaxID=2949086 RepID=A0ABT0TPZ0_9FLAO|nr:4'-phosphopantetheinyl transferase superfamily protein [Flavobacterium sp. HXWNR70]MCL9809559.1 4'-phosphopantetheinyl transferase superfamily protein [Flavobacterium sp. HXWNR70]